MASADPRSTRLTDALKRADPVEAIRNNGVRVLLVSLGVLLLAFAVLLWRAYWAPSPGQKLSLDATYRLAEAGQITEATLLDEDNVVVGRRCRSAGRGQTPAPRARCPGGLASFHTSYPSSDVATQELIERLRTAGARVEVDKQTGVGVAKLLSTFVFPLLLLANLFGLIFVTRGGDGSIAEVAGFGSFRRRPSEPQTRVTFNDVAGAEEVVVELREVIDYLRDPRRFRAYGAAVPKGVLLFGPPGCGKTLTARAVAGESGVPFFSVSGTEFVESLVGVGAARVRDLFRQVREQAPAIVFIDEIDALARRRSGEGISGGEREQTLNQLLVELDGFDVTSGIVVMGATNRPDILDPAVLRPGRFDRHVTLDAPDVVGRRQILELHARGRPVSPDVDFGALARLTPGFTGADLANVINEAALLAIREGRGRQITMAQLSEAVQRVLHGPQRRGRILSTEERTRLAYHESGHALVAAAVGQRSEVPRVSILARGRGLAQSQVVGDGDRLVVSEPELRAHLVVAMAGRAAEMMALGSASTGAEDDIARATAMARQMVGVYGLSEQVGPVRLLTRDEAYATTDGTVVEAISALTMQQFDQEVRRLIAAAAATATDILAANRLKLEQLASRLAAEETLEGSALEHFLSGVKPATPATPPGPRTEGATGGGMAGTDPRQ
jgi:cell division protease FtsH